MPLILPGNVASATASTTYDVANSCRFNDGDTAYMHKTMGTPSDIEIFTWSAWIKRGVITQNSQLFSYEAGSSANRQFIRFNSADQFEHALTVSSTLSQQVTNRKFKDCSAWYHIVVAVDTNQGTAANRVKIYVNGVQESSFSTETYPAQYLDTIINTSGNKPSVGASWDGSTPEAHFDGYMAEVYFIDGTQYAASDFGEFDEDSPTIWKPKDASGLTFGTNGFYLDFKDSANLGNDANGGTDLTEVNLAAADQATDTPTNNFATVNPLDNYYQGHAFSQGNCKVTSTNSDTSFHTSTFAVSSGKWYAEVKVDGTDDSGGTTNVGIAGKLSTSTTNYIGADAQHFAYRANEGNKETGGSNSSYGSGWGDNALIGIYLDLDNNKLYFSEDGTLQNSGTGISITAPASVDMGAYVMGAGDRHTGAHIDLVWNFGGCPSFTVSSAVADDNGYGSFEYSPNITGDSEAKKFYALNTKNLAEYGG